MQISVIDIDEGLRGGSPGQKPSLLKTTPAANRLMIPPDLSGRRAEVEGRKSVETTKEEDRAGVVVISLARKAQKKTREWPAEWRMKWRDLKKI